MVRVPQLTVSRVGDQTLDNSSQQTQQAVQGLTKVASVPNLAIHNIGTLGSTSPITGIVFVAPVRLNILTAMLIVNNAQTADGSDYRTLTLQGVTPAGVTYPISTLVTPSLQAFVSLVMPIQQTRVNRGDVVVFSATIVGAFSIDHATVQITWSAA